jgi:hypothetical protein
MDSWAFGAYEEHHHDHHEEQEGEKKHHHDAVYDITDDTTGKLHEIARQSTLTYVNETDGEQQTTIFASRDPFFHMHYFLGNGSETISIPCNQWIEVKIDYGEKYEPVRKCRGYSRTQGKDPLRDSLSTIVSICYSYSHVYMYTSTLQKIHQRQYVKVGIRRKCLRWRTFNITMKKLTLSRPLAS